MNKYVYWGYVSRDTSPIFVHGVRDFLILFKPWAIKKTNASKPGRNQIFAITEDLNKRNLEHPFVDIDK